jgi:hypothetical protein
MQDDGVERVDANERLRPSSCPKVRFGIPPPSCRAFAIS